jgi:hypothetical protein
MISGAIDTMSKAIKPTTKGNVSSGLIAGSFLFSSVIILWSFSAPFRATTNARILPPVSQPKSRGWRQSAAQQPVDASQVRARAIHMDRELMNQLAEKQQKAFPSVPGVREVKENWLRRVERADAEVHSLRSARPGSIEAEYRDSLVEKLRDAPLE